ncbi:MAG: hypothetical protein ACLQJR_19770 [Stellaceae bacterium]
MNIRSTDFLRLAGEKPGRYLLLERAAPRGRLERDVVTLKEPDDRDVEIVYPSGYRCGPLELPIAILDDLLRANFIRHDGLNDDGAEAIFRLTRDGLKRARSIAA